jgi:hypothetical protein
MTVRGLWAGLALLLLAAAGRGQVVPLVEKLAARQVRDGQPVRLGELTDVPDELARPSVTLPAEALADRFRRLVGSGGLQAEFDSLPAADQRLAVELGEVVQVVLRRHPDDGDLLLHHLGANGLALARAHGDFVLDVAHWLLSEGVVRELTSVRLPPEEATAAARTLHLRDVPDRLAAEHLVPLWLSVVRTSGAAAGREWRDTIHPHRDEWLSDGRLPTYLTRPEHFREPDAPATPADGATAPTTPVRQEWLNAWLGGSLIVALLLLAALPWVRHGFRRGAPAPVRPRPHHEPFRE